MNTPSREIIKWIQSIDLSFQVKNYKRDFSNGFILAEILSKYYPFDVQMHSYDSGNGSGARKNNWALLERVFVKYEIPITRDIIQSCSSSSLTDGGSQIMILLSLIHAHLSKISMNPSSSSNSHSHSHSSADAVIVKGLNKQQAPTTTSNAERSSVMSINQAQLKAKQPPPPPLDDSTLDNASGKLVCTKILVSHFIPLAPQLTFFRSVYQPSVAREVLVSALLVQNIPYSPIEQTRDALDAAIPHSCSVSDFHAVCETFVPLLSAFSTSSSVFSMASKVLWVFFGACSAAWGPFEIWRRVLATKDFHTFIRLVAVANMDKVPFVASIVHAIIGPGLGDVEIVRFLLEFRNMIGGDKDKEGSEYMFFFAAFNDLSHTPTHSQLTVFYLSECLTIINSYKSPNKRRALLVSGGEETNANSSVVASSDIPGMEISSIFHILASILTTAPSLHLRILSDVLTAALRTFYKIVVHAGCPSHMRKSYLKLLLAVPGESRLHSDAVACFGVMLARFRGETLKDVLYMLAPVLKNTPRIATAYVAALMRVSTHERGRLLSRGGVFSLSWDLPFLYDPECEALVDRWDAFSVIMGVLRLTEAQRGPMGVSELELVQTCLEDAALSRACVDVLFTKMQDYIFAGLGVEESSQAAWDLIMVFMKNSTTHHVVQRFPVLLAVLIYTQTLENTKCKRRLMGRLRKLATLDTSILEEQDRYYLLKDMNSATLRQFQTEAERILKIFRVEFPVISSQKMYGHAQLPLPQLQ